jgi:histidyl-tRNA synthetase
MKYSALKGVHDIYPPDILTWQKVEKAAKDIFTVYGFQELRAPIIESTDIFIRSIGETTDIVEKEMYSFSDKAGRHITLRPEGTAPVVRCYVENHLYNLPAPQKFFYSGPMFRYERPQAGRFRQFFQIGAEAFGVGEPKIDAEILSMLKLFFERLGLKGLNFEVNSIGCEQCRPGYRKALLNFFSDRLEGFCPDCKRRNEQNPLRILDCKVDACIKLRDGAPHVTDYLCGECREHFTAFQSFLIMLNIPHVVNPNMVGVMITTRGQPLVPVNISVLKMPWLQADAMTGWSKFWDPPTPAIGLQSAWKEVHHLSGHPAPTALLICLYCHDRRICRKEGTIIADRLREEGIWAERLYRQLFKEPVKG